MKYCTNCPRHCKVDRTTTKGFCGASNTLRVALVSTHYGEEPIISGTKGSGTIFFSHCNLKCVYCQNYDISDGGKGLEISVSRLVEIFKELEAKGVHNINLVSPTHYAELILEALTIYKPSIPVVYNTNGYDDVEMLRKLAPYIDIYLTDLKYYDYALSARYSNCADYFDKASKAIKQMRLNCPTDEIVDGLMMRGVVVRHLVLPNCTDDSIKVLDYLAKDMGTDTIVNLMCQYVPVHLSCNFPEINRTLKPLEYKRVVTHALTLGLNKGYIQEFSSATTDEIPKFDFSGVLS